MKMMEEFVGLKAKMYAIKVGDKETKKSKGVKKSVVNIKLHLKITKTVYIIK